jgi:hypothetical protein
VGTAARSHAFEARGLDAPSSWEAAAQRYEVCYDELLKQPTPYDKPATAKCIQTGKIDVLDPSLGAAAHADGTRHYGQSAAHAREKFVSWDTAAERFEFCHDALVKQLKDSGTFVNIGPIGIKTLTAQCIRTGKMKVFIQK